MNLLLLHIFPPTSVNVRWRQFWLIQRQSFHNKSQFGCFCMYAMFLNVVKRIKFKNKLSILNQWRNQPKNLWGGIMFDFRRITLSCLEKRLSKHKMTMFSKNLVGGMAHLAPLATLMLWICLVVACGFMASLKDVRKNSGNQTFYKLSSYWWMERNGTQKYRSGVRCQFTVSLVLYLAGFVFSTFSVFWSCVSWISFAFSVTSVMPHSQEHILR